MLRRPGLPLLLALAALAVHPSTGVLKPFTGENMNGQYLPLQDTPQQSGTASNLKWQKNFKDYPHGGVEAFTVYSSEITSTYGEVFWKGLPEIPLPAELVDRFKGGKGMAIVGFEADQVRKGAGPNGEDASVPINVAYNHHYGLTVVGSGSKMELVRRDPSRPETMKGHDAPGKPGHVVMPVEHTPSPNGLPTSGTFGYSNGGEFRKSYHGLAPPFAQVIASPTRVSFGPMQIDTWNRDKMSLAGGKFVAGPAPRNSFAPTSGPDATYSGLLECPLTTRIRKQLTGGGWNDSFVPSIGAAKCPVKTAGGTPATCYAAAAGLQLPAGVAVTANATGASAVLPAGCSVQLVAANAARVFFNTNQYEEEQEQEQEQKEETVATTTTTTTTTTACGAGVQGIVGEKAVAALGVSLGLRLSKQAPGAAAGGESQVVITLSGPADGKWFGVGFNTNSMYNSPYAVTVDGTTGKVTERTLGEHAGGVALNASVTVLKHTVEHGVRTLVLTRPLQGSTPRHHTFDPSQMVMPFIAAVGAGPTFGYHRAKGADSLALWPVAPKPIVGGNVSYFGGEFHPGSGANARNNYDGEVGYEIIVNGPGPMTVTALGRGVGGGEGSTSSPSSNKLHAPAAVTVWDVATKKAVASAVVGPASGPVENGYTYATLATPLVLRGGGARYRLTQSCTAGMRDKWPDDDANAAAADADVASVGAGVFSSARGAYPDQDDPSYSSAGAVGRWAGMVTFKAIVEPAPAPPPAATCVCELPAAPFGKGTGNIQYLGGPANPAGETIGFPERCQGIGNSVVNETVFLSRNPTCDIRTYAGGLSVCHHGWHLLDADQEVPWQDQPLTYVFKFRFYFQEFGVQQDHVQTWDTVWGIGGATGEYDVPVAAQGTPADRALHTETGSFTPGGTDWHFVAAHFHCHAPTCVSQELRVGNATGELLCKEAPYHGRGADPAVDRFDEPGYIAQRVCLWGSPPLAPPPLVSGVKLWYKAVTNNTYGHHGEMALPQMLLASIPAAKQE